MIRTIAFAALLLSVAFSASAEEIRGAWTAEISENNPDRVHIQMSRRHNNFGQTMALSSFTGLTEAQVHSATQVPVNFSLRREAGTIEYRGTFEGRFGAGQFTFTSNPAYLDAIRALGIDVTPAKTKHLGKAIDERLLQLAIQDVSTAYIRSMQAEGYRGSLDQYLEFRIFNVTPELVRELRSLGYRDVSASKLVASQIHRVTPQYIREMAAAGLSDLDLERLVEMRIHRVTREYIDEMRRLGYTDLPVRKLIEMRIHRVTPEFIRELKDAGYSNIPVDKLIAMRIHGVDAIFVKKMNGM